MITPLIGLGTATRIRRAPGTRDGDGVWVDGATTSTAFVGSFQPFPGARLSTLPEGERQQGQLEVYARIELRTADQFAGISADRVVYKGVTYEVRDPAPWPVLLNHYQARLMRVQEEEA
jgi:hypothetical protein